MKPINEMNREELIGELRRAHAALDSRGHGPETQSSIDEDGESLPCSHAFEAAFSASPIGMTICDQTGQCVEANEAMAELIGASREAVLAQNYNDLESWRTSGLLEMAHLATRTGKTTYARLTLESTFGRELTASVRFTPFTYGGEVHLLCVFDDHSPLKRAEDERERLIAELKEALHNLETLRRIVPQCSFCKRIRDDEERWQPVDVYIRDHLRADVSHSLCPGCEEKYYP